MAIWYCGSEKYTAVTAWVTATTWAVGDIRRPTAAAVGNERVFRCTTAGLGGVSEPTWVNTKASTTTDNLATWTEITGSETYNTPTSFAAPHARVRSAAAWMAAGDSLYVSSGHAETEDLGGSGYIAAFPGTATSPNTILSIDPATGGYVAGASITNTSVSSAGHVIMRGDIFVQGLIFKCGGTTGDGKLTLCETIGEQLYRNCDFIHTGSGSSGRVFFGAAATIGNFRVIAENCRFKFGAASQGINNAVNLTIRGGSIISGGSSPTNFFIPVTGTRVSFVADVSGFDFANAAAGINLVLSSSTQNGRVRFSNCKMPTSWTGLVTSAALTGGGLIVESYNLAADDTNYCFWMEHLEGSVKQETSIVATGGATDGTTPYSMKMASSATAEFPLFPLISPPLFKRNELIGSVKTVTVEITHSAAAALTDKDIYLDLEYLGTAGFPLSLLTNDGPATVLTTAVDQTTSSQAWGGAAQTFKQKLSVDVTPQEKGDFIGVVKLFKASTTVYVNPDLVIT